MLKQNETKHLSVSLGGKFTVSDQPPQLSQLREDLTLTNTNRPDVIAEVKPHMISN